MNYRLYLDEGLGGLTKRIKNLESMVGSITNLLEDRRTP
jgi:hypothetical protein